MSARRRFGMMISLSLSVSAVLLGTTILNVALPALRVEMDTSNSEQQWVLNAYTLAFAGFLLVAGMAGDRFGLRRTLLVGLAGFTLATAAAAFTRDAISLIALRAMSGVFAAAIMPISLAILVRTFPKNKVQQAIAVWASTSGLAIALGPLVGGALLSGGFWWGSVLLVVAIASGLALACAAFAVPTTSVSGEPTTPIRIMPLAMSIAGIVLLTWGVLHGGKDSEWWSPATVVPIAVGAAALLALAVIEGRHRNPLIETRLLRVPQFGIAALSLTVGTFVVYGFMYISTFYLQVQRAYSPLYTGVFLVPVSAGIVIGAPTATYISRRIGSRSTMAVGMAAVAGSLGLMAVQGLDTSVLWFEIVGFTMALGFALILTPGTAVAMSAVPSAKVGGGSALINTLRQIGSAMGVAILGSLLWSRYQVGVSPNLSGNGDASSTLAATLEFGVDQPSLIEAAHDSFTSAMQLTCIVAAAIAFVSCLAIVISPSGDVAKPPRHALANRVGSPE